MSKKGSSVGMYSEYNSKLRARDAARTCKHKKRSKSADTRSNNFLLFARRWMRFYYGRERKRKTAAERDNECNKYRSGGVRGNDAPKPKPKPPKEELAKSLVVEDVDFNIASNAMKHRTDDYAIIQASTPECVVRRGADMTMDIKFDRPYEKAKHDLKVCFEFGEDGIDVQGTKADMQVDESGKKTFKPDEWGANLVNIEGKGITVNIHIPCDCIIGEWNVSITTTVEGKDKDGKDTVIELVYEHDTDVNILFNPWCKDDTTYLPDMKQCEEYVLQPDGAVYQGSAWGIRQKDWLFGQFELGVLDTALHLLRNAIKPKKYKQMANPIKVSRMLAHAINAEVLFGNWSGDYEGGKAPWNWQGSKAIMKEYFDNQLMVRYGQCWVFSGVLTTVCRALGIPCRSVTNYGSAHDTDESCTIDKYYTPDENGELSFNKNMSSDSVWNFHVWNEVWFTRPDLDPLGKYDGWQALDSTPQEESDGLYTCGPASLVAVKEGNCQLGYDTGFVISEVNADDVRWARNADGKWAVTAKRKTHIGQNLSTKKCGVMEREDVTHLYKHPEGSEEERKAVENAFVTAGNAKIGAYKLENITKMKFSLKHAERLMIGQDLDIEIVATNNGRFERKYDAVLKFEAESYTGTSEKAFHTKRFSNKKVVSQKADNCHYKLMARDYLPSLVENAFIKISMTATVEGVGNEAEEISIKEHTFVFDKPSLTVEAPSSVKNRTKMSVKLSFKNPLPDALTNLVLAEDSAAFDFVKQSTSLSGIVVGPGKQFEYVVEVLSLRCTKKAKFAISVSSKELYDICGSATVEITK